MKHSKANKKRASLIIKFTWLLFFQLILLNCIYTVDQVYEDLAPFNKVPSANSQVKKILLSVESATILNEKVSASTSAQEYANRRCKSKFKEEIENTGAFLCIDDASSFDYRINMIVNTSIRQNISLWIISSFTLLLIPNFSSGSLTFGFKVSDSAGKELGYVEKSENNSFVTQIFLILYLPFDYPWLFGKAGRQESRLIRSAIVDINRLISTESSSIRQQ